MIRLVPPEVDHGIDVCLQRLIAYGPLSFAFARAFRPAKNIFRQEAGEFLLCNDSTVRIISALPAEPGPA